MPFVRFLKYSFLLLCCSSSTILASAQTNYLKRFETYSDYSKNLPQNPDEKFINFIGPDLPLSNKLRIRWLTQLGQRKQWSTFLKYYKKFNQLDLVCFNELAHYYTGNSETAINTAKSLWLSANSLPAACTPLFDLLLHDPHFDERYIDARIILAFNENNPQLVSYLLQHYRIPKKADVALLNQIMKNPASIQSLPADNFHGYFYVYGLKRLVSQKKKIAFTLWQQALQSHRLSEAQQQNFLSYLALYKSLRNDPDAQIWFEEVKPAFYNDTLLDWQIRLALKQENWKRVIRLIHYYQNKEDSCWQYWLARAYEAEGRMDEAKAIYTPLSKKREYYGFLASLRLHTNLSFQNESRLMQPNALRFYQPILDKIRTLYNQGHIPEASQIINDFYSELPTDDKINFMYWVANTLNWYGKSIALSSTNELRNQLSLRFPMVYRDVVAQMATRYHLPEAYIYAIIRQESAFQASVSSSAGARGLMQLMPETAKMLARKIRLSYRNHTQLFHSDTNIYLGSAYLNFLSSRFDNHLILMAAAYNAGPRQVFFWLKTHPPKEMDIWIETLPWRETRNYLKNVATFYAIYRHRMQDDPKLEQVMQRLK